MSLFFVSTSVTEIFLEISIGNVRKRVDIVYAHFQVLGYSEHGQMQKPALTPILLKHFNHSGSSSGSKHAQDTRTGQLFELFDGEASFDAVICFLSCLSHC